VVDKRGRITTTSADWRNARSVNSRWFLGLYTHLMEACRVSIRGLLFEAQFRDRVTVVLFETTIRGLLFEGYYSRVFFLHSIRGGSGCRFCDGLGFSFIFRYDKLEGHQFRCFIEPIVDKEQSAKKRKTEKRKMIFFDFETRQDISMGDDRYKHMVNFCVAQVTCDDCSENWTPQSYCSSCGNKELVFSGDETLDQFCKWLFKQTYSTVFAHNMSGFDGQFILGWLTDQGISPELIKQGLNVVSMNVGSIRILDSFKFLPLPLEALPKAFGFDNQVLKGYFPHFFNRLENQQYVGPLPEKVMYGVDTMAKKDQFNQWYEEHKDQEFDFQKEIERYCKDDVNILRKAVLTFGQLFIESTGVDPYKHSSTIASACSDVFRRKFLEKGMIGIVPHEGYRRKDKHSVVAIKWLMWISHSEGIQMQHARNHGEVKIGDFKVDGFCYELNKIFEFHGKYILVVLFKVRFLFQVLRKASLLKLFCHHPHIFYILSGCIYHGCLKCFVDRTKKVPGSEMTMDAAYQRTMNRRQFFLDLDYDYIEVCLYLKNRFRNGQHFEIFKCKKTRF